MNWHYKNNNNKVQIWYILKSSTADINQIWSFKSLNIKQVFKLSFQWSRYINVLSTVQVSVLHRSSCSMPAFGGWSKVLGNSLVSTLSSHSLSHNWAETSYKRPLESSTHQGHISSDFGFTSFKKCTAVQYNSLLGRSKSWHVSGFEIKFWEGRGSL